MRAKIGRALVTGSIGLLFAAYLNFAPTVLSSAKVADYVKNHFVREIIFGIALAIWTIRLALQPIEATRWKLLSVVGSVVILPFWVAAHSPAGRSAGWTRSGELRPVPALPTPSTAHRFSCSTWASQS